MDPWTSGLIALLVVGLAAIVYGALQRPSPEPTGAGRDAGAAGPA